MNIVPSNAAAFTRSIAARMPTANRQVERGTLLAQGGGREVDDHVARGHPFIRIFERRTDALFALLDGVVGQADQMKSQPAARDIDLDGHLHSVDAHDSSGMYTYKHCY